MKNSKRFLCTLTALTMLGTLLAGCGSSSESAATAKTSKSAAKTAAVSAAATSATAATTESAEASAEVSYGQPDDIADLIADRPSVSLPLTDGGESFTFWIGSLPQDATITGWAENSAIQELESRTGVTLDFQEVAPPAQSETYNLMIAAGDYPDIINYTSAGSPEKMLENEIATDLTQYMATDAPSYTALMDADINLYRTTVTDDGRVGGLAGYSYNTFSTSGGLMRKDWLEETGLDTPVTFDDFHDVLTAFKSMGLCDYPLAMRNDSTMTTNPFLNALGCRVGAASESSANSFYYDENGDLVYGYIQPAFKEYLSMMAQWYSEGLINPDLLNSNMIDTSKIAQGTYGLFYNDCEFYQTYVDAGQVNDPDFDLVAVAEPLQEAGQTTGFGDVPAMSVSLFITTDCDNPELALQFLDYLYSPDGSLLCEFGKEGEGLAYDSSGNPEYSELITNNPDGLSMSNALVAYTVNTNIYCKDFTPVYDAYSDAQKDAIDIWNSTRTVDKSSYVSQFTLTADETSEASEYYTDISTYVAESVGKFLTGQTSIEDGWDNYVATVQSMNIDKVTDIYSYAGERYFSK